MEKLYTKEELASAIEQANKEHKLVKLVQKEVEYDVEVLEWNYVDRYVDVYDENMNVIGKELATETRKIFDEEGNVIGEETVTLKDAIPIMVEEEVEDLETGEKKLVTVQKHHTETKVKRVEDIEIVEDIYKFARNFFETHLGYVRRKVTMQDGSIKDFLADILPLLQVGVEILVYYMNDHKLEQKKVVVDELFINECKQQVLLDFYGG